MTPSIPSSQRRWGIRMDGVGPVLEQLLRDHAVQYNPFYVYTILEIGSAGCITLRAFRDIIAEVRGQGYWKVIGIDLLPGQAWSCDLDEVKQSMDGVASLVCYPERDPADVLMEINRMYLCLLDNPRVWLSGPAGPKGYELVFIDGSHGRSCALDFEAIERKVAKGGIVVFHDYGEAEQGTDWQAVDRQFISVRNYVHRLGLAAPCVTPRKGWRFVGEIKGSRHWGGDGNSCAVVQRTEEPLASQPELSID